MVGATDYATKGEIVSVTLATGALGDSTTYDDGDVVATSSAGVGFAIERTNDKVHLLDGGKINTTFDLKDLGTDQAVTGTKAYVPLLQPEPDRDPRSGRRQSQPSHRPERIQRARRQRPQRRHRRRRVRPDQQDRVLLAAAHRSSIRTTRTSHLPCTDKPGLIVGIDTKTDQVVDLNGSAAGKAIELKLVNPRSLSINADGSALYLLADGCYEGDEQGPPRRGSRRLDRNGETTVANEAAGNDYLASMILIGGANALLESNDVNYATHWNKLEIGGALGAEIAQRTAGRHLRRHGSVRRGDDRQGGRGRALQDRD